MAKQSHFVNGDANNGVNTEHTKNKCFSLNINDTNMCAVHVGDQSYCVLRPDHPLLHHRNAHTGQIDEVRKSAHNTMSAERQEKNLFRRTINKRTKMKDEKKMSGE